MVLILEVIMTFAILLLALAIYSTRGNITFTVKVQKIEDDTKRIDQALEDLSHHFKDELSKEEKEYYEQSYGVLKTLNDILSGKDPEEEDK